MHSYSRSFARIALVAVLSASLALPALARAAGGPGGSGASGGAGAAGGSSGAGGRRGENNGETSVSNLSRSAQQAVDACDLEKDPQKCIADALDNYAMSLAEIAPQLAPELRDLPEAVATAARKVRAAKTKPEAVRAIAEAIVVVHKTIALLKADDPVAHQVATREGGFVAQTLEVADARLQKAVGL